MGLMTLMSLSQRQSGRAKSRRRSVFVTFPGHKHEAGNEPEPGLTAGQCVFGEEKPKNIH
jgi:hypothetical protein